MFIPDFHKNIPGLAVTLEEASDTVKEFLNSDTNLKSLLAEMLEMEVKNSFKDLGFSATQKDTVISSVGYTTFVEFDGFTDEEDKKLPPLIVALHVKSRRLLAMRGFDNTKDN